MQKSQKVITVSNHTKEEIIKYTRIAPEKIDVIYEGVDYNFFITEREMKIMLSFYLNMILKMVIFFLPLRYIIVKTMMD